MELTILSGAGNRFAVLEVPRGGGLPDPAGLARAVCAGRPELGIASDLDPTATEPALDGLLLLCPPATQGASARMILFNADGTRPEACGNGLRCVAWLARRRGLATTDAFIVDTDAGPRAVELITPPHNAHGDAHGDAPSGRRHLVRVGLGPVTLIERAASLEGLPSPVRAALVSVGNPHAVIVVEDERTAPVARLGPAVERHPRFPARTNVGFLAARDGVLGLRVWERGVGETLACGSGACAAAVVARDAGLAGWPARVLLPGGELVVDGDPGTDVRLTGPVEDLGTRHVPARFARAASRRP